MADPELRITFDTNIRWRTTQLELSAGDHGAPLLPDDRVMPALRRYPFPNTAAATAIICCASSLSP